MLGCTARWLIQLNELDITVVTPRGLRSQALSEFLTHFPSRESEHCTKTYPTKIFSVKTGGWCIAFNVSPLTKVAGRVCDVCSYGTNISIAFELGFPCSNNKAEYKALIIGLALLYR